jgi:hypothetical protein
VELCAVLSGRLLSCVLFVDTVIVHCFVVMTVHQKYCNVLGGSMQDGSLFKLINSTDYS